MSPHQVTKDFESELCAYTGAPFAVTTTSCTMAILLAVKWHIEDEGLDVPWELGLGEKPRFCIPSHTYASVPQSIIHAGGEPLFEDIKWRGTYQLKPSPVWDSARRFTSGMYIPGQYQCCSFHATKILSDTQGGCILHDNPEADKWFRRARFDGRTEGVAPKDDTFMLGFHCYMSPDTAARLLCKLTVLPTYNENLPNDDYPDLSLQGAFK